MAFRPEPQREHGNPEKTAVLLVNLGTPDAPTAKALKPYLRQFLSDTRVVEIPRLLWWPLLNGVILPLRSGKSAKKYASIWLPDGSPLKVWTARQASLLRGLLGHRGHDVMVEYAMRYGNPSIPEVLDRLKSAGCARILVLPLYPQYAAATTASAQDAVQDWCSTVRNLPELRFIKHYHDDPGYIRALAASVTAVWERDGRKLWPGDKPSDARLVLSFHGVPRRTLDLGDPYHCECLKTGRLLAEALGLSEEQVVVSFQSRFGKAEWLKPYTAPTLARLAREGVRSVDILCPGFPADCLETLEEIAIEGRQAFLQAGGESYRYIPCLNDRTEWIAALGDLAERHLQGWPTRRPAEAERLGREQELDMQRRRAKDLGAAR